MKIGSLEGQKIPQNKKNKNKFRTYFCFLHVLGALEQTKKISLQDTKNLGRKHNTAQVQLTLKISLQKIVFLLFVY
jgi:hypothetical protein